VGEILIKVPRPEATN